MTGIVNNNTDKNKRAKTLVYVLIGLIVASVMLSGLAYLLRNVLAKSLLEHFAQGQQLQITCLDLDLDWQVNIQVKKLCAELPDVSVIVQDAKWLRRENSVTIRSVHLQHLLNSAITPDKTTSSETLDFQLPANLPTVNIKKLSLNSPILATELKFGLVLSHTGILELSGDINARLQQQQKSWQAEVQWSLADVIHMLPAAQVFQQQYVHWLSDDLVSSTRFVSRIKFDGTQLEASHDINFDNVLALPECDVHLQIHGTLVTKLPQLLMQQNMELDLSALQNTVKISACKILPEQAVDGQLTRFNIVIPKKIYMDPQQLMLPELQLLADNKQKKVLVQNLNYDFSGVLGLVYQLSIDQPLSAFEFDSGQLTLSSAGQLRAVLPDNAPISEVHWVLSNAETQLSLQQVKKNKFSLQQLVADITLSGNDISGMQLNAVLDAGAFKGFDFALAKLHSQLDMSFDSEKQLQFNLASQLSNIQREGLKINKINNMLNGSVLKLAAAEFNGKTDINGLALKIAEQSVLFKAVDIEHQGRTGFSLDSSFSEHNITLEGAISASVKQQQQQLKVQLEQQNITGLQPQITQLIPEFTVTQGKLNATMQTNLKKLSSEIDIEAELSLNDVSGRYAEYLFSGLSGHSPLSISSAGLQLGNSTLTLNSLNVGLPIEQIEATLLSVESGLKLENIVGNTLGGQFNVKDIWLDQREQNFDVVLQNIDLAQIVALQDQPGISISGQIGGKLPVSRSEITVAIDEGKVVSQGGGVLTIKDNPAFDSIKQQQSELAFLENYHFSQLSSKVTLKPDGWLFLDLAFYGQNPDKKQAVNFNYTHQENLFTLLETLRVTNSIQDKIEKSISKGGQQ